MGHIIIWSISIKKLSSLSLLALFSLSLFAEPKQDWQLDIKPAQEYAAAGDKLSAFKTYKQLAEKENGLAQFTLAWYLKTGWLDGKEDPITACTWFKRSAKYMIPVGLQETGHCYRDKRLNSAQHEQNAIDYYIQAQQTGLFAAACDALVIEVRYLKLNQPTQLEACKQAAAQNALLAQETLVDLYADPKALNDNQQALYWLQQAAPKSAKSAYQYALTLQASEDISRQDVRYWFETSASLGYTQAYLDTAALYYQAISDELDIETASAYQAKAFMWIKAWLESKDAGQQVPALATQIIATTPLVWQTELTNKVKAHLTKYPN